MIDRLRVALVQWLLRGEIARLWDQVTLIRMQIKDMTREQSETNYDRWLETKQNADAIKRIALRLAIDEIKTGDLHEDK